MKRGRLKKRSKIGYSQSKCDDLLTPIIKLMHPHCLLGGEPTEVAHHHVHKSKSNRLRYDFLNLIPLCHKCHQALHHNESYHGSRVTAIKGLEWFAELEKAKRESVKVNKGYYKEVYERLLAHYERELSKTNT